MDHELNTLLKVSLEHIKEMIDVDTIVGEAIIISENVRVIPISRVRMGFLAGFKPSAVFTCICRKAGI